MSKRVLVIGDSMSLAHVSRAMVIARRLQREGAHVTFATGAAHLELARSEGFDPREVYCVSPAAAYEAIRKSTHIFDLPTLKKYVESDRSLLRAETPDLIIGDMRLSLNISAELERIEHWSILSGYMTPYYSAPQSPPRTFALTRVLGEPITRMLFPQLKNLVLWRFAAAFRQYRKELGLKPIRSIFEAMASPYRNLIADLPQYVPCADLPSHYRYIGPLNWEPNIEDPPWIDRIQTDVPTAYVTMGSTGNASSFERLLVTLRDARWQVVTTTGSTGVTPTGVFATHFARGSVLLQRSDIVVCHGGSGTVYQAISEGVPIIGLPTFHDQEINMERVQALNWGIGLDPIRWKPEDLLAATERVRRPDYLNAVTAGQREIRDFVRQAEASPLLS